MWLLLGRLPPKKQKPEKTKPLRKVEVWVELLDGILMPVALGFLYLLAISDVLPEPVRASRRIFTEEIRLDGTLRFFWDDF